ncbi:MAG: hypothetical protein L6R43_15895 [Planctomycetes bacterium]|nr:hypothetical protein [Planctomycetota bacterium]
MDRSLLPVRVFRGGEKPPPASPLPTEEALAMMETLATDAWTFMEGEAPEPRVRRDAVRVVRGGR